MSETNITRSHRKRREGEVLSNQMNKTIVVRVRRRASHPRFKKVITLNSKLYAHDEKGEAKVGDQVRLEECRPLSRTKRWRLIEVTQRNADAAASAS